MECFWEAFLTQSDPKELVCYLLAYRSVKKPQEYENRLKELNVSDEVKDTLKKALDEFAQKKEVSIRPGMKKRMLAIMMSALVAAGICSGVTVYADADSKTLTVGFDAEYPPFGYMDESGEYVGFDLDVAQKVCDNLGW